MRKEAKWYVYELVDPTTNSVFYVGKGSGNRIDQHEKDAAKGVCSKKTNKINSIIKLNLNIIKRKVAYFWDEQAAYDHETDVIEHYGLENLTNILPGGQVAFERRINEKIIRTQNNSPLHVWLTHKSNERIYVMFNSWIRAGLHFGDKAVRFKTDNPDYKTYCEISEMAYNILLPRLWDSIQNSEKALRVFAERMKKYQVEVIHGCA